MLPITGYADAGISRNYGKSSHMKVIGSRSGSQGPPKKVENCHSRNVKLPSTTTPVLKQSCDCMQQGVFGYVGSNGVTAIFVT